jgi:ubiquinol-cytochrome c reductase cytochrome c1 subunit
MSAMTQAAKIFSRALACFTLVVAPIFATTAFASSEEGKLDHAPIDLRDAASLQSGAKVFVNYCLNCHAASMMRYNRLRDLGLSDTQIKDNLLFTADKVGEMMNVGMTRKDAKEWFGAAPPDLSVLARARGADWLYTYLRSFYRDPATPTGWNNLLFERVAMPHALWPLSGQAALDVREFKTDEAAIAAKVQTHTYSRIDESGEGEAKVFLLKTTKVVTPGAQTSAQYDTTVRDLVNYLVWMSEPDQLYRKHVGIVVLYVLLILLVLTFALYKNFWKDVH